VLELNKDRPEVLISSKWNRVAAKYKRPVGAQGSGETM
jgi:hypothetical protein